MWAAERDPSLSSAFLSVTFLDRAPDLERFRRRLAAAVVGVRRMRQRIEPGGLLSPVPVWRDDPTFDITYHVAKLAVPADASERALLDLAGAFLAEPFDPERPLWQLRIVDSLSDGRAVLLAKFHHTITDGVGGVRLSASFLDIAPDAEAPLEMLADPEAEPEPAERRGLVNELADAAADALRRPIEFGRVALSEAAGAARDPIGVARATLGQLVVTDRAHSTLWRGHRSTERRLDMHRVDLAEVKAAAKTLGGTVNDLFVAAVIGAAAEYHAARGVDVDAFRVSIPLSTRTDRSAGGNDFMPARVLLPAAGARAERFREIGARLDEVKAQRSSGIGWAVAGLLTGLPSPLLVTLARQQIETVDFACSNVRGASFPLYVSGARVLSTHPMGPTGGTAANATVMSYQGSLDLGLVTDPAAVDDPAELIGLLAVEFDALMAEAAGT